MLKKKGNVVNKQAAKNTALTVLSFTLAGAGFTAMMMIDPMFTMLTIGLGGLAFLIRAIYQIECGRIECERSQEKMRSLR